MSNWKMFLRESQATHISLCSADVSIMILIVVCFLCVLQHFIRLSELLGLAKIQCDISMLVQNNNANFSKKATGRITFTCEDGHLIKDALQKTIETGEGQTIWMKSVGVNSDGVVVSTFNFEWTVRVKN